MLIGFYLPSKEQATLHFIKQEKRSIEQSLKQDGITGIVKGKEYGNSASHSWIYFTFLIGQESRILIHLIKSHKILGAIYSLFLEVSQTGLLNQLSRNKQTN